MQLHLTEPHACSYLPDRMARTAFVVPPHEIGPETYDQLIRRGFRRSGIHTYRPQCDRCHACVPTRIPVTEFQSSRSQRRAAATHGNLRTVLAGLRFNEEHYALYLNYQTTRHSGGEMDEDDRSHYASFLLETRVNTKLVEFRDNGRLVMVSIVDVLSDGLSSVYTFYDPAIPHASFGTYSILWQIEQCRRMSLPHLYLGYWIKESRKMSYKARFRPIEGYVDGAWRRLQRNELD